MTVIAQPRRRATGTASGLTGDSQLAATSWSHLYLVLQSDRLLDGGARYNVTDVDEVWFGRGDRRRAVRDRREGKARLSIKVPDGLALTSEDHARLSRTPAGVFLDDFSKNGTFVNGLRIVGRVEIRSGDAIKIGRAFFMMRDSVVRGEADLSEDLPSTDADRLSFPGFPTLIPLPATQLFQLRVAAKTSDAISLVGETGTGKEVLAGAIHHFSGRKGPFVPVNCAALDDLVEGKLFGWAKGAYTGADRSGLGAIRSAHRGTLFLDEILDLPKSVQAKLLRAVEQGEALPLGADKTEHVQFRLISASQRSLLELVATDRFRSDLHARIADHVYSIPPVRERREDIGLLAAAILRQEGLKESDGYVLPSQAVWNILGYSWPENVREFRKDLRRSIEFADQDRVLSAKEFEKPDIQLGAVTDPLSNLSQPEKATRNSYITLLEKHGGNITEIARELGVHRTVLYRKFIKFGLNLEAFRVRKK